MRTIHLAANLPEGQVQRNDVENVHLYIAEPSDEIKLRLTKDSLTVMVDNTIYFEVQKISDRVRVKVRLDE